MTFVREYLIWYLVFWVVLLTAKRLSEIPVIFYKTSLGVEPVREWLKALTDADRHKIGLDLATVQVGWPVGLPLCRALGDGLWEVRSNLPSNRIARLLFCVHEVRIGVVHGFIKKTQKTPREEIELALKRIKEMTT